MTNQPEQAAAGWHSTKQFTPLGLQFRADGCTGLPREKSRKIRRLFRHAWRRKAGRLRRTVDLMQRAALAVQAAARLTLNKKFVRNLDAIGPLQTAPEPHGVESQILSYHLRRGSTSPRFEQVRRKFPNWQPPR